MDDLTRNFPAFVKINAFLNAQRELYFDLGREPTAREMAQALVISEAAAAVLLDRVHLVIRSPIDPEWESALRELPMPGFARMSSWIPTREQQEAT